MTREEAIKVLRTESIELGGSVPSVCRFWEALDMAISALREQETVTKCRDLSDEDGGEILSNSSEMTLDDAIAHLDNTLSDTGRKWSCESCRQEHVQLRAWLAELREIKQNRNEPLTMDELRRMEGQPVYIVENTEYWAIVNSFDQAGVYLLSYGNPDDYGYFGLYGKTWLAYRHKPEEWTV